MKPRDSLRKLLQCWQVNPPANPGFPAAVWKRIRRARRRRPYAK